jgi:hypothetical protein
MNLITVIKDFHHLPLTSLPLSVCPSSSSSFPSFSLQFTTILLFVFLFRNTFHHHPHLLTFLPLWTRLSSSSSLMPLPPSPLRMSVWSSRCSLNLNPYQKWAIHFLLYLAKIVRFSVHSKCLCSFCSFEMHILYVVTQIWSLRLLFWICLSLTSSRFRDHTGLCGSLQPPYGPYTLVWKARLLEVARKNLISISYGKSYWIWS